MNALNVKKYIFMWSDIIIAINLDKLPMYKKIKKL